MTYNYDDIVSAAKRRLLGSASDSESTLESLLKKFANEAKDIFEADIRSQFGERKVTLTSVANQEEYSLPEEYGFGGLNRVVVDGTEYTGYPPEIYDLGEHDTAFKLDAMGNTLYLNAAPESDGLDIDIYFQIDSPDMVTGTAQAGSATSITLASDSSPVDDIYNGTLIEITGGTGKGQIVVITDYDGSTNVATASFATAPDTTSTYATIPPFPKRGRRALIEKTIELYRKRQKAYDDAALSKMDYEEEKGRALRNNIRSQERPRKMQINING